MIQICLFLFSVTGMFLLSSNKSYRKYGFIINLISQPFWFLTTVPSKQYGLIALSCVYTIAWCMGIYNYFIRDKTKKEIWNDLKFWNDCSIWKEKK